METPDSVSTSRDSGGYISDGASVTTTMANESALAPADATLVGGGPRIRKTKRRRSGREVLPDAPLPPSRPHLHDEEPPPQSHAVNAASLAACFPLAPAAPSQQHHGQQQPSAHTTPDSSNSRRKRRKPTATPLQAGSSQDLSFKHCNGFACGANGRPIVFAGVKYSVDVASLRAYAGTEEAVRTKRHKHTY